MDYKEGAMKLNQNLKEMEEYFSEHCTIQERNLPDSLQKDVKLRSFEESPRNNYKRQGYERGQRQSGRRRNFHDRTHTRNSYSSCSRSNFDQSFADDRRPWHEGYRPKNKPSKISSSCGNKNDRSQCDKYKYDFVLHSQQPKMSFGESYDDSKSSISVKSQYNEVSPISLATNLSEFDSFSTTLLTLLDKYEYNHREVKAIVAKHSSTFDLDGETVLLKPKIKLCKDHLGIEGCLNRANCNDLHMCLKYLYNVCDSENCLMGHSWKTNHNQKLLKTHFIESFQIPILNKLFLSISSGDGLMTEDLQICLDYNAGKCKNANCFNLHLCMSFLAKLCVTEDTCKLNHDTGSKDVQSVLIQNKFSVNESPRDILLSIISCPHVNQQIEKFKFSRTASSSAGEIEVKDNIEIAGQNPNSSVQSNEPSEEKVKKIETKTVWSHYYLGETALDEICYNSVEGFCKYEDIGCWRLHCGNHFHWQVREKDKFWVNLRDYQAFSLEKAFCDPEINTVDVPALDPSILDSTVRGLLLILQGRSLWEANFEKMQLFLKSQNAQSSTLELRRLCTEDSPNIPDPCFFIWYFLDKNKKWIEYGQVDSTGDKNLICSIKSDEIEKHRRQRPNSPLSFQSSKFNYVLDTVELIQRNLETNVSRNIRRRPKPHLQEADESETSSQYKLPESWEPMLSTERVKIVTLVHSSPEYIKVSDYIRKQGGNYNILKIERVQNVYLFNAFQNKVQEMTSILKSMEAVNIQQLFHGTRPENVPKICEENFDWRLHGSNVGQAVGRGTYFSPLPSTSHSYTQPDSSGHRYIFIAQVAIGSTTIGNSNMVRPPINPQTNLPFDSTVNAVSSPSIIVKYDKQEYYPEYILTCT